MINKYHRGYINFDISLRQIPLEKKEYKNNVIPIGFASFVGFMINKRAVEKLGLPKKEFFVYVDDLEYCIRLIKLGKILLINDSIVFHELPMIIKNKRTFFSEKINTIPFNTLWLRYFDVRNWIWLWKNYGNKKSKFYKIIIKEYLVWLFLIILFEDHKIKRLIFVTSAYIDGLRGNFDNTKPKIILYK